MEYRIEGGEEREEGMIIIIIEGERGGVLKITQRGKGIIIKVLEL